MGQNGQNDEISVIPPKKELCALKIDANQIPDLVPILAVLGCAAKGTTVITGAKRLKEKESDRLLAISTELNKLGANIAMTDDGLIIHGCGSLRGGTTDSHDDHRIAMSIAIASILCEEQVTIRNSGCVNKSFPTFFEEFEKLGGVLQPDS
jgi:3-phosphoshikimate 1-carboxyvinyltransferase